MIKAEEQWVKWPVNFEVETNNEALKMLIEQGRFSHEYAAAILGVGRTAVTNKVNGKALVTNDELHKFASFIGVKITIYLGNSND